MNPSMNVLTNLSMRGDEPADQQIELQEEEQPEQDLHAAEIMLRTCSYQPGDIRVKV